MKRKSLKKAIGTAVAALALTAAPVCAEPFAPAPDAEAQLDVMAASGVIEEEINDLHRTWNGILSSGMQERSMAYFYAAVTDLDRNGRLELLITWHFLNRDPLYFAGDDIGEEKKSSSPISATTSRAASTAARMKSAKTGRSSSRCSNFNTRKSTPPTSRASISGGK